MLNWIQQFSTFCLLDSHGYPSAYPGSDFFAAAGARRLLKISNSHALDALQAFISEKKSWLFGCLGYDLKNETGAVCTNNPDCTGFPDLFFFEPEILICSTSNTLQIVAARPEKIWIEITSAPQACQGAGRARVQVQQKFSREAYLQVIESLQKHIARGDCYEINFCQEFFSEHAQIDPVVVYRQLCELSPNPFSGILRMDHQWLLCASPERFLKKTGNRIISQPMKGTAARNHTGKAADEAARLSLFNSGKDRSENIMVVDLVRNDLSKICRKGSVLAEELYTIQQFPQVFQMLSTVSGALKDDVSFTDIIRATFPMGSMTGAPKIRVMQLIDQYEKAKRGFFSGALGYMNPSGDFDFNVVIRSVLYNAASGYLSFQTGSGITCYSEAEKEWDECILKAKAICEVLGVKIL